MSKKPDPKKAIWLRPGQRTLGKKKPSKPNKRQWRPHRGTEAIDPWGVGIRRLREVGIELVEERQTKD